MGRIDVRNLTKRYGAAIAVDDVSFHVDDGELCALLGPSGSGKSTVLRIIAGLERPTRGDVYIEERRVTHKPPQARNIGFVFQNYALFQQLDVFENIAFGLRIRGRPRASGARSKRSPACARRIRLFSMISGRPTTARCSSRWNF